MSETKRPRRAYKKRGPSPTENDQPAKPPPVREARSKIPAVSNADPEIVQHFRHLVAVVDIMGFEIVKR